VVNADDLGYDPEIDRGILEGHARGVVSSATAMVDTPFSAAALRAAPTTLGLGLHAVLDPGAPDLEEELRRQIRRFEALRGAPPDHLDSHKHAHAHPAALDAFARVAAELGLPVRAIDAATRAALRARGVQTPDHFLGDAALRPCWTPERLRAAVEAAPDGWVELMAHPGHAPSHARTSFGVEREVELSALCDPAVAEALRARGVELTTFAAALASRLAPRD
jgi:predicted glycoside hydrolase/deacetylase ChbG (UPF0249 family)